MIATTELEAAQQMVEAGQQQITEIDLQVKELDAQIEAAQSALAMIEEQQAAATEHLTEKRAHVAEREAAYLTASGYAKLAQKTVNEKSAVKEAAAARRLLTDANKELERLESEHEQAMTSAAIRSQELHKEVHLMGAKRESLEEQLDMVRAGHRKASSVCGELKYAQLLEGYNASREHAEKARSALLDAEMEQHEQHAAALEELASWPNLQRAFAELQPVDDSTSRMIEGTIRYVDTILEDAKHINNGFPNSVGYDGIWTLLTIPPQQLQDYHADLKERQIRMTRLLEQYRAYCVSSSSSSSSSLQRSSR